MKWRRQLGRRHTCFYYSLSRHSMRFCQSKLMISQWDTEHTWISKSSNCNCVLLNVPLNILLNDHHWRVSKRLSPSERSGPESALTFSHAIEDFYFGLSSSQNFHVNSVCSHRLNNWISSILDREERQICNRSVQGLRRDRSKPHINNKR